MEEMKEMIHFFGYDKSPSDPTNLTAFYEYDKETQEEFGHTHYGYKDQNEQVLKWVATLTPEDMREFKYQLSDVTKEVKLMDFEKANIATRPMVDWSERTLYGKSYTNCK